MIRFLTVSKRRRTIFDSCFCSPSQQTEDSVDQNKPENDENIKTNEEKNLYSNLTQNDLPLGWIKCCGKYGSYFLISKNPSPSYTSLHLR
jgi:hypothetical protein